LEWKSLQFRNLRFDDLRHCSKSKIAAMRLVLPLVCALCIPLFAEKPQQCGNGRTVDDYLVDIAKSQKKKRSKNPLPDSICVFGWCKAGKRPPSSEGSKGDSKVEATTQPPVAPSHESSSKQTAVEIGAPPQGEVTEEGCDPMRAAKDVEVGDFYYSQKSYRPALMRYNTAVENWPNEPNILFRLARTHEAMKDNDNALEYYKRVIAADPDAPLAKEANAALTRLKK
jgi:tetratricopeptide (TPR) repeat protein